MERIDGAERDMLAFVLKQLPPRDQESNKGNYGTLTALCGSARYRGAASLVCEAALRTGCGIVCLASVEKALEIAVSRTPECVCLPLGQNALGGIARDSLVPVLAQLKKSTAAVIGCGLTDSVDSEYLVYRILAEAHLPAVLDADGLNVLRGDTKPLKKYQSSLVVTPHPGEMARLTGRPISDILADPEKAATAFATECGTVCVLKGHHTVVVSPDGKRYCNRTGNAGLARGGSGDLLSGMIGALLARKIPAFEAAVCGVFLHGLSADRCAARLSQNGMLPSDILPDLCGIFSELGL